MLITSPKEALPHKINDPPDCLLTSKIIECPNYISSDSISC